MHNAQASDKLSVILAACLLCFVACSFTFRRISSSFPRPNPNRFAACIYCYEIVKGNTWGWVESEITVSVQCNRLAWADVLSAIRFLSGVGQVGKTESADCYGCSRYVLTPQWINHPVRLAT